MMQTMVTTLLGLKQNMSQRFDKFGQRIPVTEIMAEPNIILALMGAKAQLGFLKKKKAKKTENARVKVAGFAPRHVKEVQLQDATVARGEKVTVAIFEAGDLVKVTGVTRGRGFAGVVKRWGFAGGPKTHGQSDRHRAPGSIGQTTTPGRVFKGKKMAGHMGVAKHTVRNLEVIEVDSAGNCLVVKGSVPGAKNGLLVIEKIGKAKAQPQPPPKEQKEEDVKKQEDAKKELDDAKQGEEHAQAS